MTEYMSMFLEDEIMQDVWKRKAEASEILRRFWNDPEGYRKHEEAELNKLGFRSVPTGNGTTRTERIAK